VTPGAAGSHRDDLIDAVLDFVGHHDLLAADDVRHALGREIDAAPEGALRALHDRLTSDRGWGYYEPDPLARRIHHVLAATFLHPESSVIGAEHLAAVAGGPLFIFANHLSYADANVIDVLLQRAGGASVAARLTAVAGPKVFTSRQRRFSSLCFGTIKSPQSAEVSSEEARLPPREVARAARHAIDAARERLEAGDALLVFGEGSRSRTGAMQPMLAGVARYLETADAPILPMALTGSETMFPVGAAGIDPARAVLTIGQPIDSAALRTTATFDRRLVMDAIGVAVANLLPLGYRGVYGEGDQCGEARRVLHGLAARATEGGSSP
jgi:1-acyl-sn-glycerol-3-phosphate acyltransferase